MCQKKKQAVYLLDMSAQKYPICRTRFNLCNIFSKTDSDYPYYFWGPKNRSQGRFQNFSRYTFGDRYIDQNYINGRRFIAFGSSLHGHVSPTCHVYVVGEIVRCPSYVQTE